MTKRTSKTVQTSSLTSDQLDDVRGGLGPINLATTNATLQLRDDEREDEEDREKLLFNGRN